MYHPHTSERVFHDKKYATSSASLMDNDLLLSSVYNPWKDPNLIPILKWMPKSSLHILELGCGSGIATIALAMFQQSIVFTDISDQAVRLTKRRLEVNQVDKKAFGLVATSETLPFSPEVFDFAFGIGVLHHFDLLRAKEEIQRVLKPGASAIFIEPLGHNPMLNLVRTLFTEHSPDERMLTYHDISLFCQGFSASKVSEFQLFSMLRLVCNLQRLIRVLESFDSWLINHSRFARRMCRLVSIIVTK